MLTIKAPCKILMSSHTAHDRLLGLSDRMHADVVDPVGYKCLRCHCEWDDSPLREFREMVCSNCYGERIIITTVRVGFENWGDHNGGENEQRARYNAAIKAIGGTA